MIKGVLLDYGGTIDTNGVHWAEVLWQVYLKFNVPVSKEGFLEAYKFGEYSLAIHPIVKPHHNFLAVLNAKIEKQFYHLRQGGLLPPGFGEEMVTQIAADCNNRAKETIQYTSQTLAWLSAKYPLVMVSNFYGNLETVLEDFGIRRFFQSVVESAVVGVRKPSAGIYRLAVEKIQLPASECVVIGDSYTKDIMPGKEAGCVAIWLQKEGFGDDPAVADKADTIIHDFGELKQIL